MNKTLICLGVGLVSQITALGGCGGHELPIEGRVWGEGKVPEVIVTEQFLDEVFRGESAMDVRPPTMLSYWPDLAKDGDGRHGQNALSAAIFRCEDQGGEMIAEYIEEDWVHKCEGIDY